MQDTELKYVLSQRSSYLERSVMRELLKHAVDPNLIAFATGLPANEDLPTQQLQDCMNVVVERDGQKVSTKWGLHPNLKEELKPEEWKELTEIMSKVTTIVGNRFTQVLNQSEEETSGTA